MTADPGSGDRFRSEDLEAAERERRRREREEQRRRRADAGKRSLGERVGGMLGGSGDAVGADRAEGGAAPPPPERPRSRSSEAGATAGGGGQRPEIVRRRLLAAGGVLAAVVIVVVLIALGGGGDGEEEQEQAAAAATLPTTSVTVPEGLTRGQIAETAKEAKLRGSYLKASKRAPKGFEMKQYEAQDAPTLEGFLFPATYELERKAPASDLVNKQLQAFEENIAGVDLRSARKKNLTTYDVIKIASMIEREVSVPRERRLVAAVIYNRLAAGEPLGVDATLRYELDNFDQPLKESELNAATPYNTRLNAGLPPTPIGNPGLAAIEAAANPAKRDFRFYVIKPGTCNEHFFTADPAEFERAAAEYQEALEAEGGSPTDCPE